MSAMTSPRATRVLARLRRWGIRGLACFGLIAATVLAVQFLTRSPPGQDRVDVEQRWGDAIRQYGIEPVYPPEEDFTVGDVFVEGYDDTDPDPNANTIKNSSPFRRRSVKIDHIDLRDELTAFYSTVPMFMDVASRDTAKTSASWPGFKQSALGLPLAAFPDVTASTERDAGASLFARAYGAFNYAASTQEQATIALRQVEAYGLTNVVAQQALDTYCASPKNNCSDVFARRHLRSVIGVGERIDRQYIGANDGKLHYALKVRLFLVSRVYVSRNIIGASHQADARGGSVAISAPGGGHRPHGPAPVVAASQVAATPQSASPATGTDTAAALLRMQAQLDALSAQRGAAEEGGVGGYAALDDSGIDIHQTFARPVAIGYRYVAHDLLTDMQ
jgi:hypothetical protein